MRAPRRRGRGDEGSVIVLFALLIVAMIVMVGLVLDFGLLRADRKTNKSAADRATAAGIAAMVGDDTYAYPWQGICEAYNYIRANQLDVSSFDSEEWMTQGDPPVPLVGSPCESSPAYVDPVLDDPLFASTLFGIACRPEIDDPLEYGFFRGTADGGRVVVEIKAGYRMPDPDWSSEDSNGDNGDPAEDGCDQLAVFVTERQDDGFGSVIGAGSHTTRIRTVARLNIDNIDPVVAALILLERHDCNVLNIQGNSGANVQVDSVSDGTNETPGIVHADSDGSGANCATRKIYDVDPNGPASPLIVAHAVKDGAGAVVKPGVLGSYYLTLPGALATQAADTWPVHVKAEGNTNSDPDEGPTPLDLQTRSPVDERYLAPLKTLQTTARNAWSAAPGPEHTVLDCDRNVVSTGADPEKVYVDCPGGVVFGGNYTFSAPDAEIVFNGPIEVTGNGSVLRFERPRAIYVKGSATGPAITITGNATQILVNLPTSVTDTDADGELCDDRFDLDRTETTKLVLGEGPIESSGDTSIRMCGTTLFMADGTLPGPEGAAPYDNTFRGRITISGQGAVEWTAPNVTSSPPTATHIAELEDLAFWTEASAHTSDAQNCSPGIDLNCVQGNGLLQLKGIFVLPNANPFRVAGNGDQDIGADAQFWTRKLVAAGKGTVHMRPNPADSVPIRLVSGYTLVR